VRRVEPARAFSSIALYVVGTILGLIVLLVGLPNLLGLMGRFYRVLVLGGIGLAFVVYIVRWMGRLPLEDRKRVGALMALCALNIVFWGVYEQQGNTMQLWADRNTNWSFLGVTIPSTWYQAFNPAMIFIMAPLLNIVWAWQARRKQEPSSVVKMAIGCFLLGSAFIIMIIASQGIAPDQRRSVLWLVGTTFVLTVGELYLSPIGLSFVTKVSPVRIVSMMMGVWFLSSFFGNYMSGFLGTFWDRMPREAFFFMLTLLGAGAGVAMLFLSRPVNRIVAKHERPTPQT
jgi:POT family proton-dependent oligopeptide transporter